MQAVRAIRESVEGSGIDENRGPQKGRGELQGFSCRYLSCSWLTSEKLLAPMPARANRARFCLATSLGACAWLFGRGRRRPPFLLPDRLVVPINASSLVVCHSATKTSSESTVHRAVRIRLAFLCPLLK